MEDAVELAVAFHRARYVGVLGVVEHAAQLAAGVEVVADQVAIGQRDRAPLGSSS